MKPCSIYAHRGLSSEYLENTCGAFDRAVELGVDGIETDVQISRDGVSVLWHDEYLGKLGRPDARIGELDGLELGALNLSDFGRTHAGETGLVRLEDFVRSYAQRCNLILEVKNLAWDQGTGRHQANIRQCLEAAKRFAGPGPNTRVVISSFDFESLLYAHSLEPSQPLVFNLDQGFRFDELKRALDENAYFQGFCLPIDDLDRKVGNLLADHRKELIVYTCNTADQIRKAFDLGVDILISDCPQKAFDLRG